MGQRSKKQHASAQNSSLSHSPAGTRLPCPPLPLHIGRQYFTKKQVCTRCQMPFWGANFQSPLPCLGSTGLRGF